MISVVFDMDGVLFDTQKIYTRTWLEVGAMLNIPETEKISYMCIGMNRHDQDRLLEEYYHGTFPNEEFYRLKEKVFTEHIETEGVPLMKGTKELLEFLKSVNAKVAIASSSRMDVIEHHINETGLTGYFDKIIAGNMVKHSKPSPDIYLKACELLGVNPEDTYAVEDSYNGLKSAVAAKMKTIMIPDMQPATPEIDAIIYKRFDSLIDFRDYLRKEEQ